MAIQSHRYQKMFNSARAVVCLLTVFFVQTAFSQTQATLEGKSSVLQNRPFLGAFIRNVADVESRELGVTSTSGAVVTRTTANSPAALAGLKPGDVITELNENPIPNSLAFHRLLRDMEPGERIRLVVVRENRPIDISAVLTALRLPSSDAFIAGIQPGRTTNNNESQESEPNIAPKTLYRHPQGIYKIQLPEGWGIQQGKRGYLTDSAFDTLTDSSNQYSFICPHEPLPDSRCSMDMEEIRRQESEASANHDIQLRGHSTIDGISFLEISYVAPESGLRITRLIVTPRHYRCFQFVFFGDRNSEAGEYMKQLSTLQSSLYFSGQLNTVGLPVIPGQETLPMEKVKLANILQTQPRVVGFSAVSAGHPNALKLGVQAIQGTVVTEVFSNSPAAQQSFRQKDVIVQFGVNDIQTLEDCQAAIWTSPLNSMQTVTVERDGRRIKLELKISPDATKRLVIQEYRHGLGDYQFQFFARWRLHPDARREDDGRQRVYDLIESEHGGYKIQIYHDQRYVERPIEELDEFIREASSNFSDGSESRWYSVGNIPLVCVYGPSLRSQYTVYRIAFVIDSFLYEMLVIAPPRYNTIELPLALRAILGSLKK